MELFISLFPATPLGWVVQIVGSIAVSYVAISAVEYFFHRFAMHQGLPEWVYRLSPYLRDVLDEHRRLHHSVYYKRFDYEPDPHGWDLNLRIWPHQSVVVGLLFLPYFVLTTLYISLVPTIVFCILGLLHNLVWNTIHVEMHHALHPWWTKLSVYKFLARNHYLHHQDTRTRFNIVAPLADVLVGTRHSASEQEIREIERLGF